MSQQVPPAVHASVQKAFFTVQDLMSRWSVSRSTIYREIERGRLNRTHIGGQVRFKYANIVEYEKDLSSH